MATLFEITDILSLGAGEGAGGAGGAGAVAGVGVSLTWDAASLPSAGVRLTNFMPTSLRMGQSLV